MSISSVRFGEARLRTLEEARKGMTQAVTRAVSEALKPYEGPLQDLYARNLADMEPGNLNIGVDIMTRSVQDAASSAIASVTRESFARALNARA